MRCTDYSDAKLRRAFDRCRVAVADRVNDVRTFVDAGLADRMESLEREVLARGLMTREQLDCGSLFDESTWGA